MASRPLIRVLAAGRMVLGTALLTRPEPTVRHVAGRRATTPPLRVVRALGARMLVQSSVELACPRRRVLLAGAAVDAVHAVSMVPFALRSRYRRVAMVSAAVAATTAALSAGLSSSSQ